jgi:hypothetical protein
MSDTAQQTARTSRPRRRIPLIDLPGGKVLMPRRDYANNVLGVHERTCTRLNLPTTLIGGVAYVEVNGAGKIVADSVHRRNEPKRRAGKKAVVR